MVDSCLHCIFQYRSMIGLPGGSGWRDGFSCLLSPKSSSVVMYRDNSMIVHLAKREEGEDFCGRKNRSGEENPSTR